MRDEEEIVEVLKLCNQSAERLDESGRPLEAAAPIMIREGILWVLEEGERDLLKELREDVDELIKEATNDA